MKTMKLRFALSSLVMLLSVDLAQALIPEPSNLIYGTITIDDVPLTAADGHVSLAVFAGGTEIARYTLGDDPNAGDRYLLDVPLDSVAARNDGSVRAGDPLVIRFQAGSIDAEVANALAGERGATIEVNLNLLSSVIGGTGDGPPNLDSDGDGIPDQAETAMGLNPLLSADAQLDSDGDGVDNLQEYLAGTDHLVDDYPPVLNAPASRSVDATGLFTRVDFGTPTAFDALDGALAALPDSDGVFMPGEYTVTWGVSDAAGNSATDTQTIRVRPQVSFSADRLVAEGGSFALEVALNGNALDYPVTVPFTVSGTATGGGIDHDLADGLIVIDSELTGQVDIPVVLDALDAEGTETIVVTMGMPVNAARGSRAVYTAKIVEGNVAPTVSLQADQGSGRTGIIVGGAGQVTVSADVQDPNPGDAQVFDWSQSDNALTDIDGDPADGRFVFDPLGLTAGTYRLAVTVSDAAAAAGNASLAVRIVDAAPALDPVDSDGDGIRDDIEGFGDQDGDGIADYRDGIMQANVIQGRSHVGNAFLLQTEDGLRLSLGYVAFDADDATAVIDSSDIEAAYPGQPVNAVDTYSASGGTFDFSITGLSQPGDSVPVVLPLTAVIPELAEYRKFLFPGPGWTGFVENGKNVLASAAGSEGVCPSPGDAAYTPGLTEGDWCVQITIEDGGPNDADGLLNQRIDDPGTIATLVPGSGDGDGTPDGAEDDTSSGNGNGKRSSSDSSSLGVDLLLLLAACYLLAAVRVSKR